MLLLGSEVLLTFREYFVKREFCDSSFASSCVNIHEWSGMKWNESG